eukprot:CAMPEP_0202703876 /NCGR_PEP_ID=MMETSP1385-20130828/16668_1 /ASSEMBLY_ACC=CAM_ASM_000861 /TAXON_ID=933848 /ORGANISM="Elphidium margaritaceum" /LENGTH=1190 /DNA_ID=CAMNT_0049361797 /DNA_START=27 /DNA_END=3599 /DNA_ORIENTATION=-
MTETQNVATYARIRPYNPAINEDKRLTARAKDGDKILNSNGDNEDTYNFTSVFDMTESTDDLFERGMKPLLDFKILQGITSIFIVYGQSGSGKSFTLIGEHGHLGLFPMSLQYLLSKDIVESIHISSIEAYGVKATKIGFYDLVEQYHVMKKNPNAYDPFTANESKNVNARNAQKLVITPENCLSIITDLQAASHMAPTLKNPHSSRGHTVYFSCVKLKGLEDVYFICCDLAGSEGQTALGTKDEFVEGLELAMRKGKLTLNKAQQKSIEQMYKTRSLEAGCINNGLTQLQSIFRELIKKKISKAQGLGLRKILSSFITLNSAYSVLFTLSASANNNKVTKATLSFAKQTQLVKVETVKAKAKIDKDAIIRELNELIQQLKFEMDDKNTQIREANETITDLQSRLSSTQQLHRQSMAVIKKKVKFGGGGAPISENAEDSDDDEKLDDDLLLQSVLDRVGQIAKQVEEAEQEQSKWMLKETDIKKINNMHARNKTFSNVLDITDINNIVYDEEHDIANMSEQEMKTAFDQFDEDLNGSIDNFELQRALEKMGQDMSMEEVNELIKEIDENGDGVVDFEEFKKLAEKGWFIGAYQTTLATTMSRHLRSFSTMSLAMDGGGGYGDTDDTKEAPAAAVAAAAAAAAAAADKEQELITEINEQQTQIQELDMQFKDEQLRSKMFESELEELKKQIQGMQKDNLQLTKKMENLKAETANKKNFIMVKPPGATREIVHIQIGQCGNNIGTSFWTSMLAEHKLRDDGNFSGAPSSKDDMHRLEKIGVYFSESAFMKFVPRAVCVDCDPSVIDNLRSSLLFSNLFKPDNMVAGKTGTGNNFAKGHYTDGAEMVDEIIDAVRKECEDCDCLQGFQMTHALGGGCGSGLGTLTLIKLRDEYPDRIICTHSVYPSRKVSDVVVEPYNTMLALTQLLENSDQTFNIDNGALFGISSNMLKQKDPKYADLNWIISVVMSGITASLRFSGKLNGDLRKLGVNLVPFPRLHFFLMAHAPLFAKDEGSKVNLTVQEISKQMWSSKNCLSEVNVADGKYLSASCQFRGYNVATQEVDDEVAKVQQQNDDGFVSWIPNNIKVQIIDIKPMYNADSVDMDINMDGTFVGNSTAIKGGFMRMAKQFAKLYRRKAFLHWYKGEGMDAMEFEEASKNINDLVTEYQDKQDAVAEGDADEDENEDGDDDEEEEE